MKKEKLKRINKNPSTEYFPKNPIWLVFDLANGHKPSRRYVWWFDTKKQAYDWINDPAIDLKYEISKPTKFNTAENIDYSKLNKKLMFQIKNLKKDLIDLYKAGWEDRFWEVDENAKNINAKGLANLFIENMLKKFIEK